MTIMSAYRGEVPCTVTTATVSSSKLQIFFFQGLALTSCYDYVQPMNAEMKKQLEKTLQGFQSVSCDHSTICVLSPAAGASVSEKEAAKPSVRQILETLEYGPAPESPAVANAWLDDHGRSFGHFINNAWVKPSGRKTYDSVNPATGEKMATTIQGACVRAYLCTYVYMQRMEWG